MWAARFGIDTSDGCYEVWRDRLAAVGDDLLEQKDKWLPIERMFIESAMGKYKKRSRAMRGLTAPKARE